MHSDLEDPVLNQQQRIDFIFVIEPDEHGSRCKGDIDPSNDTPTATGSSRDSSRRNRIPLPQRAGQPHYRFAGRRTTVAPSST
jgi:hypothetical protein